MSRDARPVVRPLLLLALTLAGCFQPVGPLDCFDAGTCECTVKQHCTAAEDCVNGRCEPELTPTAPADFGLPCARAADCSTAICLPAGPAAARACSAPCDAAGRCPQAWDCKSLDGGAVCVPHLATLCLQCGADSDCNAAADRCLTIGGERRCGLDCTRMSCPSGYACTSGQCAPAADTCECSPLTVGLERGCVKGSDAGRCFGHEVCRGDGAWAACNALTPAREICNGADDDCDGLTDHVDPSIDTSGLPSFPACRKGDAGICTGTFTCLSDGGWRCSAVEPVPESCNGRDDDCDGFADEDFADGFGRYLHPRHCGSCGFDCHGAISNVADGGASCVLRGGPTCVPLRCERGYWPFPESSPTSCAPLVDPSCRPCTDASECQSSLDRCLPLGTEPGRSCLRSCEAASVYGCTGQTGAQGCCPSGFTCEQIGADKLCQPVGNSCSCNAARLGQVRSCLVGAPPNACTGSQTCGANGLWGACTTAMSTVELCDGVDNDCDGLADEDFIGTRGSTTYDSDLHCGACAVSCPAQWSPTLQHAVGGCDAGPSVSAGCVIVRCTSEVLAVGAPCRLDSECPTGSACDGTFRHCSRACATPADCGGGESCAGGRCGRACASSAQCTSGASCSDAGACVTAFPFVNADLESTNGCECPLSSTDDEPETFSETPLASWPYVDRNCDGVDGVAATSLFVSATSASSQGTKAQPFRSLREALAAFRVGTHSAVLVAAGSYVENVRLTDGVKVYGGYSADFSRRDVVTFPSIIEGTDPALLDAGFAPGTVTALGIVGPTVFAGFIVRGYDVTTPAAPGQPARPSYAVYVSGSGAALRLVNNHVVAGRGGQGAAGRPGVAGMSGPSGSRGLDTRECLSTNCTGETQDGGAAGLNSACPFANGAPGAGYLASISPQAYQAPLGLNGEGGVTNQYTVPVGHDGGRCKPQCSLLGEANGTPALEGPNGSARAKGAGCVSLGQLVGGEWLAGSGGDGTPGTHATGGGGGGAGGGVLNTLGFGQCAFGNRVGDLGATGGGGGAGGCAGTAGSGGGGGGASFGIFVLGGAGARPTIEGNTIEMGRGGAGGNGGPGGYGGTGGQGGEAGVMVQPAWCAGPGGKGGRGGAGGAGSGGGGGCGGIAFGIAGTGLSGSGYAQTNRFAPLPTSAGGQPGAGGASPAGAAFFGGDGTAGAAGEYLEL